MTFSTRKTGAATALMVIAPHEGPSDHQYDGIILQCVPSEYNRIRQAHFESEDYTLADVWRVTWKIDADNLIHSNFDSSRGIAGHGVAMLATGRDLSNINFHYCNMLGHYKNDCADFKAVRHQNQ